MPVEMPDISLISDSESIYAPVQRAQAYKQQQNALARQQSVRNALAANIDPATGRTNWQNAYAMGGQDVAPDLQQMQQADMMSQAELAHKRGLGTKANLDAQGEYWKQQRDTAARIGDQASWSTWRSTLPGEYQQFVPEKYSPENQRMTLATADKALELHFQQVDTGPGGYTLQMPSMGGPAVQVPGSNYTKSPTISERETGRHNLAMEQRAKVDPMQYPLLAAAVAEGRMSPDRVNSRNAGFLEQALQRNPTADLNSMAARGALMRNAGFQQKAISAEIIPEVLQNVVNAGKKLDFSDVKFIANIQKWTAGQLQDPKLTEYMTLRNDSILSIAATMRLVGMSDYATKLEEEAAAPTMSPKQLDAWMSGQMKALNPRLKKLAGLSIDGANPAATPPASDGNWTDVP